MKPPQVGALFTAKCLVNEPAGSGGSFLMLARPWSGAVLRALAVDAAHVAAVPVWPPSQQKPPAQLLLTEDFEFHLMSSEVAEALAIAPAKPII